jgi:CRISPR-associated RAMP protein (TIGR02581 family)
MLKRKLCEAKISWNFSCEGPLLIADGRYDSEVKKAKFGDKAANFPDKFFINKRKFDDMILKIRHAHPNPPQKDDDWGFFVPGSSIRGPVRSVCERIVRSLLPENMVSPTTACDPFSEKNSCSKRLEKKDNRKSLYPEACPACKLFGCAGLASRILFSDAEINSYDPIYRDMIGIDRFTGGVSQGANMRFHILEKTKFSTEISITNFELWHLGLLAYAFRDFSDGVVSIGFGKTKGFGCVKGNVTKIMLTYPRETVKIEHLGSLMGDDERGRYGIFEETGPEMSLKPVNNGLPLYKHYEVEDIDAFWESVAPSFNTHIDRLSENVEVTS